MQPNQAPPIPRYETPYFGHEGLLAANVSLNTYRTLTVVGARGSGRTRFAVEVAMRASAGAMQRFEWNYDQPPVLGQVAPGTRCVVLETHRYGDPERAWVESLRARRADVDVIVTAQRWPGHTQALALEPLSLEVARALFEERAARADPAFVAGNPAVAAICESLDALPGPLEAAATLAGTLPLNVLAE